MVRVPYNAAKENTRMAGEADEQELKQAERLAKEALPLLVREDLLPASIHPTLDDSDFAYLVQLARKLEPRVRTPGGLVERARPFLRRSLPYSDAELVGNTLYASEVLDLTRALLD